MFRIASLHIYPVKGFAGMDVSELVVDEQGPRFDREWMVVDAEGVFVTQRKQPAMTLLRAEVDETAGLLRLSAAGSASGVETVAVSLDLSGKEERRSVRVWSDDCDAIDQGDTVASWISARLGQDVRLVRKAPDHARAVGAMFTTVAATTRFADALPLLVTSQAALDELNARLGKPLDMRRFRTNVVVVGCSAHAEDSWKRVRIGDEGPSGIELVFGKGCVRCQVTTIDPDTGKVDGNEPLKALAAYRAQKHDYGTGYVERGVYFGSNYVPAAPGILRIGATVEVLAQREN
jgi:uncharacterized protein YcbX